MQLLKVKGLSEKRMRIRKIIVISIIFVGIIGITESQAQVKMDNDNTIIANHSFQFVFLGLNESQWYVVTFNNHSGTIGNETFLASGFSYKFDRILPPDNDKMILVNIYQYSIITESNSSSVLYTRQFRLVTASDVNNYDFILSNIEFLVPIVILAVFTSFFVYYSSKAKKPN